VESELEEDELEEEDIFRSPVEIMPVEKGAKEIVFEVVKEAFLESTLSACFLSLLRCDVWEYYSILLTCILTEILFRYGYTY
jgi:hypothetical protein